MRTAARRARSFDSHGKSEGYSAISARRSTTSTTDGVSSAKCSRTMNSSLCLADDNRADDFHLRDTAHHRGAFHLFDDLDGGRPAERAGELHLLHQAGDFQLG